MSEPGWRRSPTSGAWKWLSSPAWKISSESIQILLPNSLASHSLGKRHWKRLKVALSVIHEFLAMRHFLDLCRELIS